MNAHAYSHTDVGRQRAANEDASWCDEELGAFLVCDGMRGHACGEQAARLAVESVQRSLTDAADSIASVRARPQGGHANLLRIAGDAVRAACRRVHDVASSDPESSGMGCTLTLLLVANGRAAMAHVGDTRLYLLREGSIDQLSTDHTVVAELVRNAQITPESARDHELSSALTRAVGIQATVEVETLIFDVLPDDILLLCSDGVSGAFESAGEIAAVLETDDIAEGPRRLIDLANERGGADNATAVVVAVGAPDDERLSAPHLRRTVRADLGALRKVRILADLALADLLRLYSIGEIVERAPGEPILPQDGALDGLYVVLAGTVGGQHPVGTSFEFGAGETFGGPSLLVEGLRHQQLAASAPARLLAVHPDPMRRLAAARPRLVLTLLSRIMQTELTGRGLPHEPRARDLATTRGTWWNPFRWTRGED